MVLVSKWFCVEMILNFCRIYQEEHHNLSSNDIILIYLCWVTNTNLNLLFQQNQNFEVHKIKLIQASQFDKHQHSHIHRASIVVGKLSEMWRVDVELLSKECNLDSWIHCLSFVKNFLPLCIFIVCKI